MKENSPTTASYFTDSNWAIEITSINIDNTPSITIQEPSKVNELAVKFLLTRHYEERRVRIAFVERLT